MKAGVVLINFGEPEVADPEHVAAYLERIFLANGRLEPDPADDGPRRRARQLAERRAPALLAEYRAMGGSPLHAQTAAQVRALERELRARGHDAAVWAGMQFTQPDIPAAVAAARAAGVSILVGVPLYPVTGPSTTVAALEALARSVGAEGWNVRLEGVAGWHGHPRYVALRSDGIRAFCRSRDLDLTEPDTHLVFSAHGTPVRYLREGSRYDRYVAQHVAQLAGALGVSRYALGYQNHANRPGVEWTGPDIEDVVRGIPVGRLVVVPVSFVQEQSETLSELDTELRAVAEEVGLTFHRVPVPHEDPRFITLLADLVEPCVSGVSPGAPAPGRCQCVRAMPTRCLACDAPAPPLPAGGP